MNKLSPIFISLENDDMDITKYLVQNGAQNENNNYAVQFCMRRKRLTMAKYLIESFNYHMYDDINEDISLIIAFGHGNIEVARNTINSKIY